MPQIFYCKPLQKRPNRKFLIGFLSFYGILLMIELIDFINNGFPKTLRFNFIFNVIMFIIALSWFKKEKVKKYFIELTEDYLRCLYPYFTREEKIEWIDIKWIKFEDRGCTIYRESSFGKFIDTEHYFVEADSKALKEIIIQEANKRNIKLVNAED